MMSRDFVWITTYAVFHRVVSKKALIGLKAVQLFSKKQAVGNLSWAKMQTAKHPQQVKKDPSSTRTFDRNPCLHIPLKLIYEIVLNPK